MNDEELKHLIRETLRELLDDRPLTEAQAAAYLQIKKLQLARERRMGRITPYRIIGMRIRYTKQQLDDYIRNHPLNSRQTVRRKLPVADTGSCSP